ncbi:nidogen-1 [Alligator mississippiensis]|uniref:Nidogen-1 n=1 Tax=Alligator mississippiensis TaxID=8496 RepID=A0A151PDP5_ALLMI|nr:nidogen-1 [Alligator mississippiensis]
MLHRCRRGGMPRLFPHGPARGDRALPPGDDEGSALPLAPLLPFYGLRLARLHVGTNGLLSGQDFPRETQYVDDDLPTDFPAIAPFLADLDTSGGRGQIYYRQDGASDVLSRAAGYIRAGFPSAAFAPTHAVVATWEDVAAYEAVSRDAEPSRQRNTFQAVLAYDHADAYALFLYPDDGIQFFGTRPKESYHIQLELPARVGFSRGETDPGRENLHYSVASSEQGLKNLYQSSNVLTPGVWVFHIGSASPLENIVPAGAGRQLLGGALPTAPESVSRHATAEHDYPDGAFAIFSYDENEEDNEEFPFVEPTEVVAEDYDELGISLHTDINLQDRPSSLETDEDLLELVSVESPTYRQREDVQPYPDGGAVPAETDVHLGYPEGEVVLQSYPDSPLPFPRGRHIVGVDEDVSFNTDVFTYSAASQETCEQHHGLCSPHAFCTDYATGFCCHCQTKFYGNGRHCLPEGAAHRLNGKVSGNLLVGRTPVHFADVDLHAYVVGNDGRAYTAISRIPQLAARALMPLTPIGGLFGWLFALEKPGYENGFSITGAEFTHSLEATFYPGKETVHITQTAEGLGLENYLSLRTHIQGRVPYIPENFTVHIAPYKELYYYSSSAVTSMSHREYSLLFGHHNQTLSYRLHQNVTFQDCPHARARRTMPATQQLSVERVFALYNEEEQVLRYAVTNQIGSAEGDSDTAIVNPCYDGTHVCDTTARCQPGAGLQYSCECTAGYRGDGQDCVDIDECAEGESRCGPFSVCLNSLGSYRCECQHGYHLADDRHTCVLAAPPPDPCAAGRHSCAAADQARCIPRGGGAFSCECLPGYTGDGHNCSDVNECTQDRCHPAATCLNTPGSFSCQCRPGYDGDGFQCTPANLQRLTPCEHERLYSQPDPGHHIPVCDDQGNYQPLQCHSSTGFCWCVDEAGQEIAGTRTPPGSTPPRCGEPEPTARPQTMCERWRQSLLDHYGGRPREDQYVPQCDAAGSFSPLQCHGNSGFCWCVDEHGREIHGTRSEPGTAPPCLPSVAPPTVQPSPRPDVSPPAVGTFLLYAQGHQIGYLPLNGTRLQKEAAKTLLALHGSIVVGIDYDCRGKMVYWTDVAGRTVNRASLEPGAEPETVINSGLMSPEGLVVDHLRRAMFWTDSGLDKIERANLDGSQRRALFSTDLVNPRAITVDPIRGNLYWTDWNREAPKIETSTVEGANRRILVNEDIGLPNGLTFDPFSKLLCWADAGTKKLECTFPDGTGRHVVQNNLNYPFSIVSYANHFYHTDWRRDGVIAVNKDTGSLTEEYLPEQRSHLYGITAVYPYCPGARK